MGKGGAAVARKGAVFDRLPSMTLRAVPSRAVKLGHVVIDLHPEVYQQVQFEDHIMSELEKKIDMGEDRVVGTLSKVIITSSLLQSALLAYGLYDRVSHKDKEAAAELLAGKLNSEQKIAEKIVRERIAQKLEELAATISSIQELANQVSELENEAAPDHLNDSQVENHVDQQPLLKWALHMASRWWGRKE